MELISLGYTTLRTPDGRLIVLPNSIAASQVMINLSQTFTPWQMSITIRIARGADLEAARRLAISIAAESVGEKAVYGCYLTRMEPTSAVLELRLDLGRRCRQGEGQASGKLDRHQGNNRR